MKTLQALGLLATTALLSLGAWLGCSGDKGGATIGGADGGSVVDASGGDSAVGDSGGGDSAARDSGSDGGDSGGGDGGVSCATYCGSILANCTGANAEYLSRETCLAMCEQMNPGMLADTDDTVGCRQYHAGNAAADPAVHCKHAGLTGGATCGMNPCDPFCALVLARCNADAGTPEPYADTATCVAECASFTYEMDAGDLALQTGDTLNCRIYHLQAAWADGGAQTHCPHTATTSDTCQ